MNKKNDKNNIENIMDLTSTQQGMLFYYISNGDSKEYHEQLSLTISGDVKIDLLQKAWNCVIETNEMLRTVFRWKGIDKPVQIVLKRKEVLIQYLDITDIKDKYEALKKIKTDDLNNRIDITKETIRIYLCKLCDYKYEMIISNHHIIYDGWSNAIILKELIESYNCLYEGKELKKVNKTSFGEFIKFLKSLNKDEQRNYWVNCIDSLDIKNECFYSNEKKEISSEFSYKIDILKTSRIKDFTKQNKVSLASVLFAIWGVLTQKLSNSNEVLFGTVVSGRTENIKSIDNIVGIFINTIPLRIKAQDKSTFMNLIHEVDKSLAERKKFENTSLADIRQYCGLKANEDIFNTIVTIENYPLDLGLNAGKILSIDAFEIVEKVNYNLSIEIFTFENLEFKFSFNNLTLHQNMVKRLSCYLEKVIDTLLSNRNIEISEINILSEEEKNQILYEYNDTKIEYPINKTLEELFEEQVDKTPQNTAFIFKADRITYEELNKKANQVARRLREKGVSPNQLVGLMIERSIDMIVGILAILKAGGAYLPIEPGYPQDRVKYILENSQSSILLTKSGYIDMSNLEAEVVDIGDPTIYANNCSNLERVSAPQDLAYTIYTSGSTGRPKGVMITHEAAINTIMDINSRFMVNEKDNIIGLSSVCFDLSVYDIFGALSTGGKLVQIKDQRDVNEIIAVLKTERITIWNSVPAIMDMLVENIPELFEDKNLRLVMLSGDWIPLKLHEKMKKYFPNADLISLGGATEASIWSIYYPVKKVDRKWNSIPYGMPLANQNFYVLNKDLQLCPFEVPGELYIGGIGLAKGYLNDEEKTKKAFIKHCELGDLYKTGDWGKFHEEGYIEFLGRRDQQIKIRGYRIELGEIEQALLTHQLVKDSLVVVKEDKSSVKYLCAYIVLNGELNTAELRKYLSNQLPDYMVPSCFMELDSLPLNSNGKIDRNALPEPTGYIASERKYEAPANEIQQKLARIWSEVLDIKDIGIYDNFFELGGHSLKATRVACMLEKEFNVEISIADLFSVPTIEGLDNLIRNSKASKFDEIKSLLEQGYYELSYAQKRLWIINQVQSDSTAYNMAGSITFFENVDRNIIEKVFDSLISRHEAFRTSFKLIDEIPVQVIDNKVNLPIEFIDLSNLNEIEKNEERKRLYMEHAAKTFNLEISPLIYVKLVKIKDKEYDLLFSMHHIISDGWSMEILRKEFFLLYNGYKEGKECSLKPLRIQYKDFAAWQNELIQNKEKMRVAKEFWCNQLNGELPILDLPVSYSKSNLDVFDSAGYKITITNEQRIRLKDIAREYNTSLFAVLLATFKFLLADLTRSKDILIAIAGSGRDHADLKNIIGYFINTTILRNKINMEEAFGDLLKKVSTNTLSALEYQNYPIELILDELKIKYPKIPVFFNMLNMGESDKEYIEDFKACHIEKVQDVKFDMVWYVTEYSNGIEMMCHYPSMLFEPSRIEHIMERYIRILQSVSENPNKLLREYNVTGKKRKI